MENRFYNRDFEDFVKRNADQYRMFPSEKVWKNIHHNLHTRRRWYAIGFTLLFLTMGTVTWVMVGGPSKNNMTASPDLNSVTRNIQQVPENRSLVVKPGLQKNNRKTGSFMEESANLQTRIFLNNIPPDDLEDNREWTSQANENIAVISEPLLRPAELSLPLIRHEIINTNRVNQKATHLPNKISSLPVTVSAGNIFKAPLQDVQSIPVKNQAVERGNDVSAEKKDAFPLTIESVTNAYQYRRPKKRISWEVFFTPTVTYRKLSENKDFIASAQSRTNSLNYTAFTDINNLVLHKPDFGLQLGVTAGYPLLKNVKITGGFQFNVSKYDIRAFNSPSEVATIALDAGGGVNSVSTSTNYRNFNGTDVDWLRNLYFSASVPVGLEFKLGNINSTQFGIRGTVQPTFILGNEAYLLSTDYKNYAEVPSLIRKFNINTGIELYATYTTGRVKWKVGPQARYQARSSFKASYPVKEHLFDFGLKLGVMLR
jgi:hypothetical protein